MLECTHVFPTTDPTLTMRPDLREAMYGNTAWNIRMTAKKFASNVRLNVSNGMSAIAPTTRYQIQCINQPKYSVVSFYQVGPGMTYLRS